MSVFYSGAGAKLAAGLQSSYFNNANTTVDTKLNITSATFDPAVEKASEETLLQSKVKNGSLLTSITMDASFDANLRPEMSDWIFSAAMQQVGTPATPETTGYSLTEYTLKAAGNDPLGSTLVLTRSNDPADSYTYPGMTVRSMTMTMPNNDFVTVSMDLAGREEIRITGSSAIDPDRSRPITTYTTKTDESSDYTKSSYIVTNGIFKWNNIEWCIESSTLTIDNGIEDSPRCYQDGKYANIPVMGMRSVTLDLSLPYDNKIETLKRAYLLTSDYGSARIEFTNADDPDEKVIVEIPHLSITSVGAGISGTGVVEASVSGEAVEAEGDEPLTIYVQTKETV